MTEQQTNSELSIEGLFQSAIKCEWNTRRIYIQFSRMFSELPEVSQFWLLLANDEEKHARILEQTRDNMKIEQLSEKANRIHIANITNIFSLISKISIKEIQNLDDAYEIAHEIETSEVNNIFKLLTDKYISDKNQKETIISDLICHIDRLTYFTDTFGNKAWRKGIIQNNMVTTT